MRSLFDGLSEDEREKLAERDQPGFTEPMLATLTHDPFDDDDWMYERKLDGVRILVFREGGRARAMTRNGKDRSATYFEVRDAFEAMEGPDCVVDGEVVAFSGNVTSFERLQKRMRITDEAAARERAEEVNVYYYVFDLLHVDGFDVTALPRTDSPYVHARSKDWLKFKCVNRQELVIGGFTEPSGQRKGFGALLVGYHSGDELLYAGKVGTRYTDELLLSLRSEMDRLERRTSPFAGLDDPPGKGVHWVTPKLVGEVRFTEWTDDGRLRHPRFVGLREDKEAADVVREEPAATPLRDGSEGGGP